LKLLLSIVSLFMLNNIINADIYSGSMYEDINASVSMDFDRVDVSESRDSNINFSDFNGTTSLSKDDAGIIEYNDVNLSNTTSVKQLLNSFSNSSSANAIIQKMSKQHSDFSNYSTDNIDDLKNENLKSIYTDSRHINAMQKNQDAITSLLNTFGSQSTIKCYIKRNLSPSFYCPLVGKDRSYYTGGVANTSVDQSKNECNVYCQTPQTCLPVDINGFSDANPIVEISKTAPMQQTFTISDKQLLKNIEVYVKGIDESHHAYLSIDAEIEGTQRKIVDNYDIELTDGEQSITFPLSMKNFTNFTISISTPYKYDLNRKKRELVTQANAVILQRVAFEYAGDRLWLCPETQMVRNRKYCTNGKIVSAEVGGSPALVCVKAGDMLREKTLGAYYSQGSCEKQCFAKEECTPTYRHLSNGITSSIYNVDYGCLEGLDNASCTKELCKDRVFSNIIPNSEIVYYNDSQKEITVSNGQEVDGTLRPIYNVAAEMSSNNSEEDKKTLMISISKDMAYRAMLKNSTYVISGKALSEPYSEQTRAIRIGGNGVSIEYLPRSDVFNTGADAYVYFITANYYTYNEEIPGAESIDGKTPINTFRSVNYTLIDSAGNMTLFYLNDKKEIIDSESGRVVPYSSPLKIKKMSDSNGTLISYDLNAEADFTLKKSFDSDLYKDTYLVSNAYYEMANNTNGANLKRQISVNGHIVKRYAGSVSTQTGGTIYDYKVYLTTSDSPQTYQDIINKIDSGDIHIAYSQSFNSSYTKPIRGHASYDFDGNAIKIFILGKSDNISAIGEFVPEFEDEGKEAFVFNFLYKEN